MLHQIAFNPSREAGNSSDFWLWQNKLQRSDSIRKSSWEAQQIYLQVQMRDSDWLQKSFSKSFPLPSLQYLPQKLWEPEDKLITLLPLQTQKANFVPAKTNPVSCHSPSVWEWHSHFPSSCFSFHSNNTGIDHPLAVTCWSLQSWNCERKFHGRAQSCSSPRASAMVQHDRELMRHFWFHRPWGLASLLTPQLTCFYCIYCAFPNSFSPQEHREALTLPLAGSQNPSVGVKIEKLSSELWEAPRATRGRCRSLADLCPGALWMQPLA